nr:hypothetical protein PHYPA_028019 [Physcomitrium patens]
MDTVTGMVYWIPVEYSAAASVPAYAPLVVPPYTYIRSIPAVVPQAQPAYSTDRATVLIPDINTTVFVRGIPREATTQTVGHHFKIFGPIQSCHVIRHKDASTNKGIAFVKFYDAVAAQRAIDCTNPGVMEQREIFAEWAHPKPYPSPSQFDSSSLLPLQASADAHNSRLHLCLPSPVSHLRSPIAFIPTGQSTIAAPYVNSPWIPSPRSATSFAVAPFGSHFLPGNHVLGFPYADFGTSVALWRTPGAALGVYSRSPVYVPVTEHTTHRPAAGTGSIVQDSRAVSDSMPHSSHSAHALATSLNIKSEEGTDS